MKPLVDANQADSDAVEQAGRYMLDTTEFNAVAKREIAASVFLGRRLFATHVQLDELDSTPCAQTRAQLRAAFEEISAESVRTESAVWGVSRWDHAKWSTKNSAFEEMRIRLEALDGVGEKRRLNQLRDILIAETAIRNNLTLISGDSNLRTVTIEFGGRAIDREQFGLDLSAEEFGG